MPIALVLFGLCLMCCAFIPYMLYVKKKSHNDSAYERALECQQEILDAKKTLSNIISDKSVSSKVRKRIEEEIIWVLC